MNQPLLPLSFISQLLYLLLRNADVTLGTALFLSAEFRSALAIRLDVHKVFFFKIVIGIVIILVDGSRADRLLTVPVMDRIIARGSLSGFALASELGARQGGVPIVRVLSFEV